ncbi:hypothetical protein ACX3X3_13585 [Bacillus subtilis]|uniref:hypothetical protein n=1 Tax=Bacillus subtilis TaxID=1423 RepID=UPI0011C9ABF2|nr:hypothetical protein [Bacillus subtilis]TXK63714.1 hypothetical protein FVD40_05050 [Bacillus subtilis]HEQ3553573.1 hypothetical protein [Enterococcus faecalis]
MPEIDTTGLICIDENTYLTKEASDGVLDQLRRHFKHPDLSLETAEDICSHYKIKRETPDDWSDYVRSIVTLPPPVLTLDEWYEPIFFGYLPDYLYLRADKNGHYAFMLRKETGE